MAIVNGPFQYDGSAGGFRSYWDKDLKKRVLSTKRTWDKNAIKNNPELWRVNAMNEEFKGCNLLSKIIRQNTEALIYLKNGRITGKLINIAKRIQEINGTIDYGTRKIETSKFNAPLIGFCMNNAHPFKDVFHVVPEISITDDRRVVMLKLNNFISHLKFKWPERVFYYRVYLTIFELPDIEWYKIGERYISVYPANSLGNKTTVSEWIRVSTDAIDFQITAAFDEGHLPREKTTVLVAMGLEFASDIQYDTPFVVRDHGTMSIVACL